MKLLLKPLILFLNQLDLVLDPLIAWVQERPSLIRWLKVFRLGLFQFGIGLSLAPITGTLNRVLIDDLGIAAADVGVLN